MLHKIITTTLSMSPGDRLSDYGGLQSCDPPIPPDAKQVPLPLQSARLCTGHKGHPARSLLAYEGDQQAGGSVDT